MVFLSGDLRACVASVITYVAFNVRGYSRLLVIAAKDLVSFSPPGITYYRAIVSFSYET